MIVSSLFCDLNENVGIKEIEVPLISKLKLLKGQMGLLNRMEVINGHQRPFNTT